MIIFNNFLTQANKPYPLIYDEISYQSKERNVKEEWNIKQIATLLKMRKLYYSCSTEKKTHVFALL